MYWGAYARTVDCSHPYCFMNSPEHVLSPLGLTLWSNPAIIQTDCKTPQKYPSATGTAKPCVQGTRWGRGRARDKSWLPVTPCMVGQAAEPEPVEMHAVNPKFNHVKETKYSNRLLWKNRAACPPEVAVGSPPPLCCRERLVGRRAVAHISPFCQVFGNVDVSFQRRRKWNVDNLEFPTKQTFPFPAGSNIHTHTHTCIFAELLTAR